MSQPEPSLSQFHQQAELTDGGRSVTVTGPLSGWGAVPNRIELVVLLTQDGVVARGRGSVDPGTTDLGWEVPMTSLDAPLRPGRAIAMALAVVEVTAPLGFQTQVWTEEITLVEQ